MSRFPAFLSVDLEDYRRQELRDHLRRDEPPHPREVERQLDGLLTLFDAIGAGATFFTVGRLAGELASWAWREIAGSHRVGCHGHEHHRVRTLGPKGFARDLIASKSAVEDATGLAVVSHRAPYFSSDHCDPWFGEVLDRAGLTIDSSRRLRAVPSDCTWVMPLEGSGGRVGEVPLPAIGFGSKRITVIGGSYLRLLPLAWIVELLERGRVMGFLPTVYLHPYDIDAEAAPLDYGRFGHGQARLGDWIRRVGRSTVVEKITALARIYEFRAIEDLLAPVSLPTTSSRVRPTHRRPVP